jgi:hypothetical protein
MRASLLALLISLAAAASARAGETACWFENGAIVAPAAIGDMTGDFVIDLSAPRTLLHDTIADILDCKGSITDYRGRKHNDIVLTDDNFTTIGPINLTGVAGSTVRLVFTFQTDAASPYANPAIDNVQVSMNCVTPAATFAVVENCAAQTFSVNANVSSFGFGTTGSLAYTVNDSDAAKRLQTLGLVGLITDAVDRFIPDETV